MKKIILLLVSIIICITSMTDKIKAKDIPVVTFNGSTGEFSSTSDQIYTSFGNVVPGDRIEQDITFKLKNINGLTKLYIEIQNDTLNVNENIKFKVYADDKLILDGINKNLSSYLICQSETNKEIDIKVVLDVPTSVGNEIKNISKENIWNFVVEDDFGKHTMVITGIDDYSETYSYLYLVPCVCFALFVLYVLSKKLKHIN